jgi:hypothetical protein
MSFSIGGFFKTAESDLAKVGEAISNVFKLANAVKQMWSQCGAQTIVVASQVFYDVIKTATLAEQAAQAGAGGSWAGAVTLSEQTISSVSTLVSDFKNGEAQIVTDFKTLKYDFTNQTTAA